MTAHPTLCWLPTKLAEWIRENLQKELGFQDKATALEEDHCDIPLEDCWYTQPKLFFTCHLHPKDGRLPLNGNFKNSPNDLLYHLVFFNTFEDLKLPIKRPLEDAGLIKQYEPPPTLCLYVAPVQNMSGRVPLIPLLLAGNSTLTIPHLYSKRRR